MPTAERRVFRMIVTVDDDGAGRTEGQVVTEYQDGKMPSLAEQLGALELARHHLNEQYSEEAWRRGEAERIANLRGWARFRHWMGWEK